MTEHQEVATKEAESSLAGNITPKSVAPRQSRSQVKTVVIERVKVGGNSKSRMKTKALIVIIVLSISITAAICWLMYDLLLASDTTNNKYDLENCKLQDDFRLAKINYEQGTIRVPSADFRTLVKFVGSLEYPDNDEEANQKPRYLPLRLQTISHVASSRNHTNRNDEQQLVLMTSCARVTLHLATDSHQLVVGSIELETVRVGRHLRVCQVSSTDIKISDVRRHRYSSSSPVSCADKKSASSNSQEAMRLECKSSLWLGRDTFVQQTVGQLIINQLEFELDGRPEAIRQNEFSKSPETCACK